VPPKSYDFSYIRGPRPAGRSTFWSRSRETSAGAAVLL